MNTIITIGRQFGSGGHEIGEKLAAHYGIKYFDKEFAKKCFEIMMNDQQIHFFTI